MSILDKTASFAGRVLLGIGHRLMRFAEQRTVVAPEVSLNLASLARWRSDCGDETLRIQYDLGPDSLVFDVGGYKGQWASDIYSAYCCSIHVFEPVHAFASSIRKRFAQNPKIVVHESGLAGETRRALISISADGSSVYRQGGYTEEVSLVRITDFMRQAGIHHIDLMKVNIEGGEYSLLADLIETELVTRIGDILVQFHSVDSADVERMLKTQQLLRHTHELTWQYPLVWENWKLKDTP